MKHRRESSVILHNNNNNNNNNPFGLHPSQYLLRHQPQKPNEASQIEKKQKKQHQQKNKKQFFVLVAFVFAFRFIWYAKEDVNPNETFEANLYVQRLK